MELEDLPPRYREQAARQIEARQSRRRPAPQTPPAGMKFDSRGEYEYYMASILPGLQGDGTRKICVVAREGILRHKAPGGAFYAGFSGRTRRRKHRGGRNKKQVHTPPAAGLYLPPPAVHRPHCGAKGVEVYRDRHIRHRPRAERMACAASRKGQAMKQRRQRGVPYFHAGAAQQMARRAGLGNAKKAKRKRC